MPPPSSGSVGEGDTWRSAAIPRTIISRPEVSGLGLAGAGIKHRRSDLIHEELGRALHVGNQRIEHRPQFLGRPTDPIGERGAVEVQALAAHDLRLPIER